MRTITQYFYCLLSLSAVLFTSCASVFNGSTQRITIRTNSLAKEVIVNGEKYPLANGETSLKAKRDKEPLIIRIKTGDSLQHVSVKSGNSFNYLLDAYCTYGLSCLVERKNPKRYYHPENIYLEQNEGKISVFRFPPVKKGTTYFNFSIPYVNLFYTRTTNGRSHAPGFLGIGAGLDFYYKDNTYISFQAGAAIDNEAPFPVGVDHWGKYQRTNSLFFSARLNHTIRSFDIGYGLSFSGFNWSETDTDTSFIDLEKNTRTLGLSLATYYRVTKKFRVGVLYQPALLSLDNGFSADYQHLLSIELLFKFGIKKGRQ